MDFNKLADFIKNIGKNYDIPGCDISVYYNHINVFRRHSGYSDSAAKIRVTGKNLYFMNSGAKILCCVAVMQQAQRFKLSLKDKISDYIGDVDADITIGELVHTYSALNRVEDDLYSFETIKKLIAATSGMSFDEFIFENITKPLKMKSTTFNLNDKNKKKIAKQYNFVGSGREAVECHTDAEELHNHHSGCLITTVDDYAKFCEALCGGGVSKKGYRLLNRESVDMLINGLVYKETEKDDAFVCIGYNGSLVLIDTKKKITIVYAQHMRNMSAKQLEMYPKLRKIVYECIGADTWSMGYNIFP